MDTPASRARTTEPAAGTPLSRAEIIRRLDREIEVLGERTDVPDFVRTDVGACLAGIRRALARLEEYDGELSNRALQEIARAYLMGRRDFTAPLGRSVRTVLWESLDRSGLPF